MLDSIRFLIQDKGLTLIFKSALAIAFLLFAFKKVVDGRSNPAFEFGKMMLLATAIWHLFLTAPNDAKHRYVIVDKVTGDHYVVEQVPTGIGEPLRLITNLEDKIINAMEKYFSLPHSLSYRESGFGFPLRAQITIARATSPDIYFQRTFKEFIANCTIYEIEEGSKNVVALATSNDLLTDLQTNDTRLTKVYSSSNPTGIVKMCKDAYEDIKNYIQSVGIDQQINLISAQLRTSNYLFENRADYISKLFFDTAKSARDYLQQNFVINMTKDAFKNIAMVNGISAGQVAYANAITDQFAKSNFIQSGILAGEYLPIIKGVLLVVIIALSWIMALLTVMFMDFRYIKMYFTLLLWMLMWSPILAIINYIGDMHLSKIFSQITSSTGQTLTLFTANKINETTSSALAWLGYLVWLVPPLAYAIVKASEYGFISFASSLAQTAQRPAQAGAQAEVGLATATQPSIRIGNHVLTDLGGATQSQTVSQGYGENYNIRKTQTNNETTVNATELGSGATASASFSGNDVKSTSYSSPNYGVNVAKSMTTTAQNMLTQAQSKMKQASTEFGETIASAMQKQYSKGYSTSINASNMENASHRRATTESMIDATRTLFSDSSQYQKFADELKSLAGQGGANGGLNLQVAKVDGGFKYTFSNSNGDKRSIVVSADKIEAFNREFGSNIADEFATSKDFRESFASNTNFVDSETLNEASSIAEKYSEAYQQLEDYKAVQSYLESQGVNISKNALNTLFRDLVQDYKNRGASYEEAVKGAMSEIRDAADRGELWKLLKDRNVLDMNKILEDAKEHIEQKGSGITTDVNENINKKQELEQETGENIGNAKEKTNNEGEDLENKVETGLKIIQKGINEQEENINKNIENQKQKIENAKERFDDLKNQNQSYINTPLFKQFLNSHKDEIIGAGALAALGVGATLFGAKKGADFAKSVKERLANTEPEKLMDEVKQLEELEKRIKNGGNVKEFLKEYDPNLLKQLENSGVQFNKDGSLKTTGGNFNKEEVKQALKGLGYKDEKLINNVADKLSNKEVVKEVAEEGFFTKLKNGIADLAKDPKNFIKAGAGFLIEGTLFAPTTLNANEDEMLRRYAEHQKAKESFEKTLNANNLTYNYDNKGNIKIEEIDFNNPMNQALYPKQYMQWLNQQQNQTQDNKLKEEVVTTTNAQNISQETKEDTITNKPTKDNIDNLFSGLSLGKKDNQANNRPNLEPNKREIDASVKESLMRNLGGKVDTNSLKETFNKKSNPSDFFPKNLEDKG